MKKGKILVLGASPREERYSHKALKLLLEMGYEAVPVHPKAEAILGQRCHADPESVPGPVDTITLYVGAEHSTAMMEGLLAAEPRRIIFNPGTENAALEAAAREKGIETVQGCTLVMLRTNQF